MSNKRTSTDPNENEKPNEDSDQGAVRDGAKRSRLNLVAETTLQDLPNEAIERILVKAVVMEVTSMRVVKDKWKEKADPVIERLRTVCLRWNSICATDIFRNEVHRTLDAQDTLRFELLRHTSAKHNDFATMNNELYQLCRPQGQGFAIIAADCEDTSRIKSTIWLPESTRPAGIAASAFANCIYYLQGDNNRYGVLKVTMKEDHTYEISLWKEELKLGYGPKISEASNGNVVIFSSTGHVEVMVFHPDGSLLADLDLFTTKYRFRFAYSAIQNSRGNVVFVSSEGYGKRINMQEIDLSGTVVRRSRSSFTSCAGVGPADDYGRFAVLNNENQVELFNSDLQLVSFIDPHQIFLVKSLYEGKFVYNKLRNELYMVLVSTDNDTMELYAIRLK